MLPYPRRATLGDGGAELPPVDPLPLLQPAPDHPLQLPHTAAQRSQLSFIPLLGLLREGTYMCSWKNAQKGSAEVPHFAQFRTECLEEQNHVSHEKVLNIPAKASRADSPVQDGAFCQGVIFRGAGWLWGSRAQDLFGRFGFVCKAYRETRCFAGAPSRRYFRLVPGAMAVAVAVAATTRVRPDAERCRDIVAGTIATPVLAAPDSPSRGGGQLRGR